MISTKALYAFILALVLSAVSVSALSFNSPADNAEVSGSVNINVTATQANATANVSFYLDNTLLDAQQNTENASHYNSTWNSSTASEGTHVLRTVEFLQDGNSTEKNISVFVNNVNTAPNITSSPVTTGKEKVAYQYQVTAADEDNDVLTYSLESAPSGMSINNASGLITWTPNFGQNGTYNLTVSVSDGELTASQSYNLTVSTGTRLKITSIEIKTDGKKDTLSDGEKSRDVSPGDDIDVKVTVANLFDSASKIDIENIEVEGTLKDIDDGDDLDDDDELDVEAGEDKEAKLRYEIPLNVDEKDYTLEITARGRGTDGITYNDTVKVFIVVDKKSHEVRITKAVLNPESITCSRETVLNLIVYNLGSEDEDETVVTIQSSALNVSIKEELELDEGTGDSDDDSSFAKLYPIRIDDSLEPGTYSINVKTYYNTDNLDDEAALQLKVDDCIEDKQKEAAHESAQKDEIVVIMPKPSANKQDAAVLQVKQETAEKKPYTRWVVTGAVVLIALISLGGAFFANKQ